MKRVVEIIIFWVLFTGAQGQNLVTNGDFEDFKKCPNDISQLSRANGWFSPSKGTSDYFNACSKNGMISVPKNISGRAFAHSGNAYVGIGMFWDNIDKVNYEFIQTKLKRELTMNTLYCISFYVHSGAKNNLCFGKFSMTISTLKIKMSNWDFIDEDSKKKSIYVTNTIDYNKKQEWVRVCECVRAIGGEKYLTIGFDRYRGKIVYNSKKLRFPELFYYIDDVTLVEIKDSSECLCNEVKSIKNDSVKVEIVKSYYDSASIKALILNNIVFESNKSNLLPASNSELDKLANYIQSKPSKRIELFGYTDDTGKEADNLKLSEARAKAVADYLITKGIDAKRITFKGYGSKNSIVPNDTEEHKQANRRVEFILKE